MRWRRDESSLGQTLLYSRSTVGLHMSYLGRLKRSFENAFRNFATIVRTFFLAQFFREQFLRSRPSDRGHGLDLKFVRDSQLFSRAFVIETLHSMHHQALVEALEGEIFPGRTGVVRMRNRWFIIVIKNFARNEHDQNRGI